MSEVVIDRHGPLLQISCDGINSFFHAADGAITFKGPKGPEEITDQQLPMTFTYPAEGGKLEIFDSSARLIISTWLPKKMNTTGQARSFGTSAVDVYEASVPDSIHESIEGDHSEVDCTPKKGIFGDAISTPSAEPSPVSTPATSLHQSPCHETPLRAPESNIRTPTKTALLLTTEQKAYIKSVLQHFSSEYLRRRSEVTSKVISDRDIPNVKKLLNKLRHNKYSTVHHVMDDFDILQIDWDLDSDSDAHRELKDKLSEECENGLLHCPESDAERACKRHFENEGLEDSDDEPPISPSRKRTRRWSLTLPLLEGGA